VDDDVVLLVVLLDAEAVTDGCVVKRWVEDGDDDLEDFLSLLDDVGLGEVMFVFNEAISSLRVSVSSVSCLFCS